MSTGNILLPRAKDFVYYHYDPSKAAAIIFLVLFTTSTLHHFYQMMRTRTWYFIPFFIGGVLETIGYVGRVINANETPNWTQTWFIVQYMGILLAPALFAASIYMILGRIVLLTDAETHSFVRLKWMTATFVSGDVLSFLVQALGGGMSASGSNASTGQTVLVIGLFIQIVFFSMFAINSWVFMLRLRKSPTTKSKRVPWMKFLATLYVVSALILVRSIYRVVEYIQGQDGSIMDHEVFLYVFDATLMSIVMLVFNVRHPSEITALFYGGRVARLFSTYRILEEGGESTVELGTHTSHRRSHREQSHA